MKWSYKTQEKIVASPAVADLDNNGKLETIIGSGDGKLYCISETGQLIWEYQTANYICSTLVLADIDFDGVLDITFGSTDNSVYCLSLSDVSSSGNNPWYCFRGSVLHTGWMDSDNDFIDDLTESYLYSPNYPYLNTGNTTFEITISSIIIINIGIPLVIRKLRKRKNISLL